MAGESKRSRGKGKASTSQSRGDEVPVPPSPVRGFETVVFEDDAQKERFVKLEEKVRIIPTKFADYRLLDHMDIFEPLLALCASIGMPTLPVMLEHTYNDITLEFLSSFEYYEPTGTVRFRIRGVEKSVNEGEFAELLGFYLPPNTRTLAPPEFNLSSNWFAMTGIAGVSASNRKPHDVQHPVLKYLFALFGHTIFGRPDPSKTNDSEAQLVGAHLNCQRLEPWRYNFIKPMLKHFVKIAAGKFDIVRIGGIVTYIGKAAGLFQETDQNRRRGHVPTLDVVELTGKNRWIEGCLAPRTQMKWFLNHNQWFYLPCPQLPPLDPPAEGVVSYLIPPHIYYTRRIDGEIVQFAPTPAVDEEMETDASATHQFGVPEMGQGSGFQPQQMGQASGSFPQYGQGSYTPVDYTTPGSSYVAPPAYYEHHDPTWRDRRDNQFYAESRLHYGAQYHMGVQAGVLPSTGTLPSYYTGPDGQAGYNPDHILSQHGIDPTTYNSYYHMTYGGWDGQFLGNPRAPPPPPGGN